MGILAAVSSDLKWDELNARPIGVQQWKDAYGITVLLNRAVANLPIPVPGADPAGFIWLTYTSGEKVVAIELRENKFFWTVIRDGMRQSHDSKDARGLVESLRATF